MDIRAFRKRVRLTGRELADRLGVDQTAVVAWEKGRSFPKYAICAELIRLGISLDELFGPDLGAMLAKNGDAPAVRLDRDEVKAAVREALRDLLGNA